MNDTVSNVLGALAAVLLLAALVLVFFQVEKQLTDYVTRRCRCQCAEEYVPPVAPKDSGLIFTPSKGVK